DDPEPDPEDDPEPEPEEEPEAAAEVSDPVADKVPVLASVDINFREGSTTSSNTTNVEVVQRPMRRVPRPTPGRAPGGDEPKKVAFVASGMVPGDRGGLLETSDAVGDALYATAKSVGSPTHTEYGREERFPVASLDYKDRFPADRVLD